MLSKRSMSPGARSMRIQIVPAPSTSFAFSLAVRRSRCPLNGSATTLCISVPKPAGETALSATLHRITAGATGIAGNVCRQFVPVTAAELPGYQLEAIAMGEFEATLL